MLDAEKTAANSTCLYEPHILVGEEGETGMCDILDMCYEKGKHRVLWAASLGRVPRVIWASGRLPEEGKAKLRSSPKSSSVGLGCIRRHNQ